MSRSYTDGFSSCNDPRWPRVIVSIRTFIPHGMFTDYGFARRSATAIQENESIVFNR